MQADSSRSASANVRNLYAQFAAAWSATLSDPRAKRYSVLATSVRQLDEHLAQIESRTQHSLVNMQSRWWIDPHDRSAPLDERSRHRGVTVTLLVPKRAVELSPLLPSIHPDVWVAPVLQDAMLIDGTLAILSGGFDDDGRRVFCSTTDAELVGLLRQVASALKAVAMRPEEITGRAPMTPRQVQVALAIARGDKDTSTARRLGASVRTVEREVSAILRHLDVRNRHEAALQIIGERT